MTAARTALALSPHLDDAVFSAGGTLAKLARTGWRVIVATVFTKSVQDPEGFALACQLDKGLLAEIDYMALRRQEDAQACAAIGAETRWLRFAEAPHRGYGSAPALFAGLRGDDAIAAPIACELQKLIGELRPAMLLAPQAIGGHVDHEALVLALDHVGRETPTLWWRDYPYTVRRETPKQPFEDRFRALRVCEVPLVPEDRAAKLEAALAYRSQLGFQFGGAEALRACLEHETVERFMSLSDAFPS